jgi:hypothetical protein
LVLKHVKKADRILDSLVNDIAKVVQVESDITDWAKIREIWEIDGLLERTDFEVLRLLINL